MGTNPPVSGVFRDVINVNFLSGNSPPHQSLSRRGGRRRVWDSSVQLISVILRRIEENSKIEMMIL